MMVCDNCDGDFAGGDRNILQLKNGRVVLCDPCLRKLDG